MGGSNNRTTRFFNFCNRFIVDVGDHFLVAVSRTFGSGKNSVELNFCSSFVDGDTRRGREKERENGSYYLRYHTHTI
jgi:hypothetical protein